MALAYEVADLDSVAEENRSLYVQTGSGYRLDITGAKSVSDVDALETALKKRLAERTEELARAKDSGASAKEIRDMARMVAKEIASEQGDDRGESDRRAADLERELAAAREHAERLNSERDAAVQREATFRMESAMSKAVAMTGVRSESATNLMYLAMREFEVSEDGSVVSKIDSEFGPNLTPEVVFEKMKADPRYAPFWPASRGGGAGGGGRGGGGASGPNPWTHDEWNRTAQAQLIAADRDQAATLAKIAGQPLIGGKKPPPPRRVA